MPVVVAEVSTGLAEETFDGIGRIAARDEFTVTAEASGRVIKVAVEDGGRVEQGNLLIELETRDEAAALAAAEARLATVRAEYERDHKLLADGYVAEERFEQSRAAYDAAKAEREAARVALENRVIEAPFDGRVGLIALSPGDYVRPGDALFTLVTDRHLEIEVDLPAEIAVGLASKATIIVRPGGEASIRSRIITRDAIVDPATNLVTVKALISDAAGRLKPGQVVPVSVITNRREDAIFVPESAILLAGPQHYVFRVDPGGVARRAVVEIGMRAEGRVEIRAGLSEGERVVVEGQQKLRDGQEVESKLRDAGVEATG